MLRHGVSLINVARHVVVVVVVVVGASSWLNARERDTLPFARGGEALDHCAREMY